MYPPSSAPLRPFRPSPILCGPSNAACPPPTRQGGCPLSAAVGAAVRRRLCGVCCCRHRAEGERGSRALGREGRDPPYQRCRRQAEWCISSPVPTGARREGYVACCRCVSWVAGGLEVWSRRVAGWRDARPVTPRCRRPPVWQPLRASHPTAAIVDHPRGTLNFPLQCEVLHCPPPSPTVPQDFQSHVGSSRIPPRYHHTNLHYAHVVAKPALLARQSSSAGAVAAIPAAAAATIRTNLGGPDSLRSILLLRSEAARETRMTINRSPVLPSQ